MLWLYFAIAFMVIILLFVLILFLRIYIRIQYTLEREEQKIGVSIFIAKLQLIQKDIPLGELHDTAILDNLDEKMDIQLKPVLKTANKILEALKKILRQTKLHDLNWNTLIGTGEASSTGIASGMLWSVKGSLVGYFLEKVILTCNPVIQVNPEYQRASFQTNLDCMVSIRLGKAILGFLKLTRILKAK